MLEGGINMTTKQQISKAVIALGAAVLLSSCGNEGTTSDGKVQETAIRGSAVILVDEEIAGLLEPAKKLYDKAHPDAKVTFQHVSSRDAVHNLLDGSARGIVLARNFVEDETQAVTAANRKPFPQSILAKDAIVFYAAKSFPYDTMSSEHIVMWFRGDLKSDSFRSQYPNLNTAPTFVVPGVNSSVTANVVNIVLNGKSPARGSLTSLEGRDSVKTYVLRTKNAIGVGLLSQFARDTSVKLLQLSYRDSAGVYQSPKPVHQAYVAMKKYPFIVPIVMMLRDPVGQYNLPGGVLQYLARTGDVQRTFLDAGIVPGYARIELTLPE